MGTGAAIAANARADAKPPWPSGPAGLTAAAIAAIAANATFPSVDPGPRDVHDRVDEEHPERATTTVAGSAAAEGRDPAGPASAAARSP